MVDRAVGGRQGRLTAAGLDDRRAAVLALRHERVLQPGAVGDDLGRRLAVDLRVGEVGVLRVASGCPRWSRRSRPRWRRRPSSPARATARLWSSRVIAVQRSAGMSRPLLVGDQAVRVARVADDEDAHVAGARSRRAPCPGRRRSCRSCRAGPCAPCPACAGAAPTSSAQLHAVERLVRVVGDDDVLQRREAAVVQLHRRRLRAALQRPAGFRAVAG